MKSWKPSPKSEKVLVTAAVCHELRSCSWHLAFNASYLSCSSFSFPSFLFHAQASTTSSKEKLCRKPQTSASGRPERCDLLFIFAFLLCNGYANDFFLFSFLFLIASSLPFVCTCTITLSASIRRHFFLFSFLFSHYFFPSVRLHLHNHTFGIDTQTFFSLFFSFSLPFCSFALAQSHFRHLCSRSLLFLYCLQAASEHRLEWTQNAKGVRCVQGNLKMFGQEEEKRKERGSKKERKEWRKAKWLMLLMFNGRWTPHGLHRTFTSQRTTLICYSNAPHW